MLVKRMCLMSVGMAALLTVVSGAAVASSWGGHNGMVRLSFTDGETVTPVTTIAADANGMTKVDLYAIIEGVESVVYNDSTFNALGGFEGELKIEGGEAVILHQEFPYQNFNVGQKPGQVRLGIVPGLPLVDGRATLVHWQLLFTDQPENVVFRLDPKGALSCANLEGCPGTGTDALFTGSIAKKQEGLLFSAVGVPAYLNWPKPPEVVAKAGQPNWRDVPLFAEGKGTAETLPADAAQKVLDDSKQPRPPHKVQAKDDK